MSSHKMQQPILLDDDLEEVRIERVYSIRYLGLNYASKFLLKERLELIAFAANKMLGFIPRTCEELKKRNPQCFSTSLSPVFSKCNRSIRKGTDALFQFIAFREDGTYTYIIESTKLLYQLNFTIPKKDI